MDFVSLYCGLDLVFNFNMGFKNLHKYLKEGCPFINRLQIMYNLSKHQHQAKVSPNRPRIPNANEVELILYWERRTANQATHSQRNKFHLARSWEIPQELSIFRHRAAAYYNIFTGLISNTP